MSAQGKDSEISAAELDRRKEWLQFTEDDAANLEALRPLARREAERIIDRLYEHFLRFEETAGFLRDAEILRHVKEAQRRYFLGLTSGEYGVDYVRDRLRVGAAHERVTLETKWYLGAYSFYLGAIGREILSGAGADAQAVDRFFSLVKLMFLDVGLAIDTYISAREGKIRAQEQHVLELNRELRALNESLERRVQEQVKELERVAPLKRYLSPQVVDAVIAGRQTVQFATHRKNLTVCFTDIRGFTGIAEQMEPEEVIDLLNSFFAAMCDIIFRHGGTLDKFLGDGLMVFFGDPVPQDDHAERAVRMALEMQAAASTFNLSRYLGRAGDLKIGAGINTGYVTVGNVGSPSRLDYTVIGNNVNVAARLASTAGPGSILVTDRTVVKLRGAFQTKDLGEIPIKGSARPIRVHEVIGEWDPARRPDGAQTGGAPTGTAQGNGAQGNGIRVVG